MTFRREYVLAALLVLLVVGIGLKAPEFLTIQTLLEQTQHLAEVGIIACGMTLVIMTGGIDLSVGSLVALCAIVMGYTWKSVGAAPALTAVVATGLIGGAVNGGLITVVKLPPLVATLGTMALFRGGAMLISKARPVSDFPSWFSWFGRGEIGPMPAQLPLWLGLVAITAVATHRMTLGRYAGALGNNERAARFAAIPVATVKFWIYVFTGLLCAIASVVFVSRVSTAKADAGEGWALEVVTAVVLGGTAITGGRGSIIGTLLGVLLLGILRNGLGVVGVPSVWRTTFAGVLLIVTAVINQRMLERAERRPAKSA